MNLLLVPQAETKGLISQLVNFTSYQSSNMSSKCFSFSLGFSLSLSTTGCFHLPRTSNSNSQIFKWKCAREVFCFVSSSFLWELLFSAERLIISIIHKAWGPSTLQALHHRHSAGFPPRSSRLLMDFSLRAWLLRIFSCTLTHTQQQHNGLQ